MGALRIGGGVALAVVLSACGPVGHAPHPEPNPHPQAHYQVFLTLDDTPGPVERVSGTAVYAVEDVRCLAYDHWTRVHRVPAEVRLPVVFTAQDAKTYTGQVAIDALKDGAYWPTLRACHWVLASVETHAQVQHTTFDAHLDLADVESGQPNATFFRSSDYAQAGSVEPGTHAVHTADRTHFVPHHEDHVFSMTLRARWAPTPGQP